MENENEITCDNCGGTDFTTEGGFYYCIECQTQSQEIREQIFDRTENVPVLEKKVTLRKERTVTNKNKLTSWETFNYILRGLVRELEGLGVDESFKTVVYHLWMKYLTKLELISENANVPAKLGAVYNKRDAEIVYQRKYKRKRSKSNASSMSKDMDDRLKFSVKNKSRKLMEKAEYDTLSQTIKSDTQSIANQTLSGLTSDEESSTPGHITLNKRSRKELLRHMTKKHLDLHLQDVNNEMTCHKNFNRLVSEKYLRGSEVITRNKLYCFLYLAAMLTQQEMQVSDLLRYCREGHLSFLAYKHFFEEVNDNLVDHTVYSQGKQELPTYAFIRTFTYKLYHYLDLRPCDFSPNILKLCRRYCTELNLPDQIYNMAGNYITKTRPYLENLKHVKLHVRHIPNYEGRAMAFILYVLKILLGFDDVTEYELSKFAQIYNQKNLEESEEIKPELFSFSDWFTYIEYRKIFLKRVHFPTWHLLHPNKDCPLDLYCKFVRSKRNDYEAEESSNLSVNVAKKFLLDIELLQDEDDTLIEFEHSFTPFRSYLNKLQTIPNMQVLDQSLNQNIIKDTSQQSIEYLLHPNKFLKQLKLKKTRIIFNNAHPNHKFQRILPFIGEFFTNTYDHWEQKLNNDFTTQKAEQLAFDTLTNKLLEKHVSNVAIGPNDTHSKRIQEIIQSKPRVLKAPEDKRVKHIKEAVGRNRRGKFCKKDDPEALKQIRPVKKGKWHVSSWNETKLVNTVTPSLLHQVRFDLEEKERLEKIKETQKIKKLNEDKYRYHYIPRMEYCSNIRDVTYMSKQKFKEFEATLPKNFQWLLKECARTIEQSTKELYQEFVNVEVYMNYIYLKNEPLKSRPLSNEKAIYKLMKIVKRNW